MKEALLGATHPDVAVGLSNLAVIQKSQGQVVEADALYQRALSIFETSRGPTHPSTVTCRENHAVLRAVMRSPASSTPPGS